jgi:hypothetical protein
VTFKIASRFALLAFVISGVMLTARWFADLVMGVAAGGVEQGSKIVHVTVQVVLLLVWRLCRSKTLGATVIEVLDAALTVGLCVGWALVWAFPRTNRSSSWSSSPRPIR